MHLVNKQIRQQWSVFQNGVKEKRMKNPLGSIKIINYWTKTRRLMEYKIKTKKN